MHIYAGIILSIIGAFAHKHNIKHNGVHNSTFVL